MTKQALIEERPSYFTLLYRKNGTLRLLETVLFLAGFALLFAKFPFRSPEFVQAAVLLAAGVMMGAPAVYLVVFRPMYILYPDRLVMKSRGREETWMLTEIEKDFDLPYVYNIRGRRVPLLVGNRFLEELNVRLEVIKRGWNSE
jgi:hypothetical protein